MQINNPLQLNDWEIKKFLKVVLAIQLAMWGVIGLDVVGLRIPILREFVGFIYLTLIPGITILRVLKLHKLSTIETFLYSVGLSIAALMFMGLFMNTVYPYFGISRPISFTPLIITISIIVLILCILSYVRDKDFSDPSFTDVRDILSPPALFLCLIPFLAIFGTYLVNFYHTNIILMLLIIVIVAIASLVGVNRILPKKIYPLAIFVISLSLLYHHSLITLYIVCGDVLVEYHDYMMVALDGYWNLTISEGTNSMLSVTILPAIYSSLLNMDGAWLFKAFYPFIFSFVPLGLYHVYRKQTDESVAFLSIFFFLWLFAHANIALMKQMLAEFFFMLLILLMINEKIDLTKRRALFIVFGASMVVSHYGVSYIFMFTSLFALVVLYFMKGESRVFTRSSVLIYITMALSWYMYVGSGAIFENIVCIGDHIYRSIFTEFLSPEVGSGMGYLTLETVSPLHQIHKNLLLLMRFFIVIGVIQLILKWIKRKELRFNPVFFAFSIVSFGICITAILVPYFSKVLGTTRLIHITDFFLAPFCVIGAEIVFKVVLKVLNMFKLISQRHVPNTKVFVSVILILLMLFNTGFIYEVTKDHPSSNSLSLEWANKQDVKTRTIIYSNYIQEQDVVGGKWLSKNMNNISAIYTDSKSSWALSLCDVKFFPPRGFGVEGKRFHTTLSGNPRVPEDAYIYLGYLNVVDGIVTPLRFPSRGWTEEELENITEISPLFKKKNKIYSNGGSEIYK